VRGTQREVTPVHLFGYVSEAGKNVVELHELPFVVSTDK
jgi:hypothetical protein